MFHASGVLGDQLYIYGGQTAQGAASDMWTYNIPAGQWAQVREAFVRISPIIHNGTSGRR